MKYYSDPVNIDINFSRHDIAEILLKVALNKKNQSNPLIDIN